MEDREIVNLYWERNSNAIKETASKYGGYCKAIAKNILGKDEVSGSNPDSSSKKTPVTAMVTGVFLFL